MINWLQSETSAALLEVAARLEVKGRKGGLEWGLLGMEYVLVISEIRTDSFIVGKNGHDCTFELTSSSLLLSRGDDFSALRCRSSWKSNRLQSQASDG